MKELSLSLLGLQEGLPILLGEAGLVPNPMGLLPLLYSSGHSVSAGRWKLTLAKKPEVPDE